jgi:hypothetical protein
MAIIYTRCLASWAPHRMMGTSCGVVLKMLGARGLSPIMALMIITSTGWLLPHYVTKTCYLHYLFSLKQSFQSILGEYQEFWIINVVRKHFGEQCIWYNYTLFIWKIFWDWKKWRIMGKQHTRDWWIKVSLYMKESNRLANSYQYTVMS